MKNIKSKERIKNTVFKKYPWLLPILIISSFGLLFYLINIGYYLITFGSNGTSTSVERWGQYGDFVGGISNAFFSLINVCVTVVLAFLVNDFSRKNSEYEIEQQRQITIIQLKHEAFKVLVNELQQELVEYSKNKQNTGYGLEVAFSIRNFGNMYFYLFGEEVQLQCQLVFRNLNRLISESKSDQVDDLYSQVKREANELSKKISRNIIEKTTE